METLIAIVALAGGSAAAAWWWLSRPRSSSGQRARGGVGEPPLDGAFVFQPSDAPPDRTDRPPPSLSVARLALTVAVTAIILVAVAWLIGLAVKVQVDTYFNSGG